MKIKKAVLKEIISILAQGYDKNLGSILSKLRIENTADKIKFSILSDLSIYIEETADDVGEVFDIAIDLDALKSAIEKFEMDIDITVSNDSMTLKEGKFLRSIPVVSGADFPHLKTAKKLYKIKGLDFVNLLDGVQNLASTDVNRPVLNCVHLYFSDGNLFAEATDARAIVKKSILLENFDFENFNLMIPIKTINTIVKSKSENIEIGIFENSTDSFSFIFRDSKATYISKLICGAYPNVEKILGNKVKKALILKRDDFLDKLRKFSDFDSVSLKFDGLKIFVNAKNDKVLSSDEFESEESYFNTSVKLATKYLNAVINTIKIGSNIELFVSENLNNGDAIRDLIYIKSENLKAAIAIIMDK